MMGLKAKKIGLGAVYLLGILLLGLGGTGYGAPDIGVEYLGQLSAGQAVLSGPGRLALGGDGTLYVTDGYRNHVAMFNGIGAYKGDIPMPNASAVAVSPGGTVYAGSHKDYSVAIVKNGKVDGYLGMGAGEFKSVTDIAVNAGTGNVYVADSVGNAVKVYTASGRKVGEITDVHCPMGVTVADNQVFILNNVAVTDTSGASMGASEVAVYNASGNFVRYFGDAGLENCQLARPTAITAAQGMIYVSDAGRDAVLVYDATGACLGEIKADDGGLDIPVSVALSGDGVLFVATRQDQGVQAYSIIKGAGAGPGVTGK
jgi:DNA-binding beta-propeller fold protein YncE